MENEMIVKGDMQLMLDELDRAKKVCTALLKTPHYAKMGEEGIFAIVQKASSLGIKPIEALNGGMYFVQGKVELSSILMAKLIRQQKHSITMDKNSTSSVCILHGKRADNGDTWRASFSIDDAKRAGIYSEKGPWGKYPDVMCYNRALSKLARQLFPDVIGNCYVEGEISEDPIVNGKQETSSTEEAEIVSDTITHEQADKLDSMIGSDQEFREIVLNFIQQRFGKSSFLALPVDFYQTIYEKIEARTKKQDQVQQKESSVSMIGQDVLLNNAPKIS